MKKQLKLVNGMIRRRLRLLARTALGGRTSKMAGLSPGRYKSSLMGVYEQEAYQGCRRHKGT